MCRADNHIGYSDESGREAYQSLADTKLVCELCLERCDSLIKLDGKEICPECFKGAGQEYISPDYKPSVIKGPTMLVGFKAINKDLTVTESRLDEPIVLTDQKIERMSDNNPLAQYVPNEEQKMRDADAMRNSVPLTLKQEIWNIAREYVSISGVARQDKLIEAFTVLIERKEKEAFEQSLITNLKVRFKYPTYKDYKNREQ